MKKTLTFVVPALIFGAIVFACKVRVMESDVKADGYTTHQVVCQETRPGILSSDISPANLNKTLANYKAVSAPAITLRGDITIVCVTASK
jgi:hypothetical protein